MKKEFDLQEHKTKALNIANVRHLLTVLKNGYEFNNDEIMFNDCDEMAKFIGFKDFKDLQEKVDTPKVFEIIVNCA